MDNVQSPIATPHTPSHNRTRSVSLKKYLPYLIGLLVVLALIFFAVKTVGKSTFTTATSDTTDTNQVALEKPVATQSINKTYSFSLRDDKGKEVSKIKYTIQNAELRNDIVVKGQRATAVAGRTFLILNLKIRNDYDKRIQINSRDYVRLSVNNSDDRLAADIHNDPVDVEPASTKITRLGFPINTSDKNLTLYVGELDGKKDTIHLTLQ
jgi:hypothetical protein